MKMNSFWFKKSWISSFSINAKKIFYI
jgi:hypothetical protein